MGREVHKRLLPNVDPLLAQQYDAIRTVARNGSAWQEAKALVGKEMPAKSGKLDKSQRAQVVTNWLLGKGLLELCGVLVGEAVQNEEASLSYVLFQCARRVCRRLAGDVLCTGGLSRLAVGIELTV